MKKAIKITLLLVISFLLLIACSSEQEPDEKEEKFLEVNVSLDEVINDKSQIQSNIDFELASVEVKLESTTGEIKRETKVIDYTAELKFRFAELELDSWEISVLVKDDQANIIYFANETIDLNLGGITKAEITPKLNTANLEVELSGQDSSGQIKELISGKTITLDASETVVEFKDLKPYNAYFLVEIGDEKAEQAIDILPGRNKLIKINIDSEGISID